jgi:hypothetical protein
LELGMSENQLAEAIGISLDSYCDIEWHADELFTAVELRRIKKLAETLGIEIFELLSLQCPFCGDETVYIEEYRLPRNELIKPYARKWESASRNWGNVLISMTTPLREWNVTMITWSDPLLTVLRIWLRH